MAPIARPLASRLWAKVLLPDPATGCMYFTGTTTAGYGKINVDQYPRSVHRLTWELVNGPIPSGLVVDHECHNRDQTCLGGHSCQHRRCCNPSHLAVKTSAENVAASANATGNRRSCPQGHPYDAANTYVNPRGHRFCRTCARAWRLAAAR